ncbi:MAG: sulfotransferase family protein [Phormidesmis sp.]
MKKEKVFCIGAAKTGTTSLGRALDILGYSHKPYSFELSRRSYQSGDYEAVFEEVKKFDSFDDGPWNRDDFYKRLDERFPDSKFILTVRDVQSWIKSHEKHFSSDGLRQIPEELWMGRYDEGKKADLIERQEKRDEEVLTYFKTRPSQLLVLDICGGEGWEKLCQFLDLPIPNKPFPVANVTLRKPSLPRRLFNKATSVLKV